jgi:hypothetical protein
MNENTIDSPNHAESSNLDIASLVTNWVNRETRRQLDYVRSHPPLLQDDHLIINSQDLVVSMVNEPMLWTEWPKQNTPNIPFLSVLV